jgi:hypothetical protein
LLRCGASKLKMIVTHCIIILSYTLVDFLIES